MKIIFYDEHIVVCQKSCGELSEGNGGNCLPFIISQKLCETGEKNTAVYPVHRLDRETSGLIVYARNSTSAAALSQSILDGNFEKEYLAVLCGVPTASEGTLSDLLFYDRGRGKSFVVNRQRAGVKKASLDYSTISVTGEFALVRVRLRTGRTHQIRVQFSSRGLPIVGDRRYGAPKHPSNGIALLSYRLYFPHPKTKKQLEFSAEIPVLAPWSDFFNVENAIFSQNRLTKRK